jgi:hypothetical protein
MSPAVEGDRDAFVLALLDPDLPPPGALAAWHGERPMRRFAVYRNNLFAGLIKALEARFPVCARRVGAELFRAMACAYVRVALPRTPILLEYGENFADVISVLAPVGAPPYLADLARLEYALGRAYHAADAAPLPFDAMRALPSDRLYGARLSLHPSMELVRSEYPVVSIWRENLLPEDVLAAPRGFAQDALVARPRFEVEVYTLPPGGYVFAQALAQGKTVSSAAETAARAARDFDLTDCFRALLASQAIIAIHLDPQECASAEAPARVIGE